MRIIPNLLSLSAIVCLLACGSEETLQYDMFCDGRKLSACDPVDPECYEPLLEFIACVREKPKAFVSSIEPMSREEWEERIRSRYSAEEIARQDSLGRGFTLFELFLSYETYSEDLLQAAINVSDAIIYNAEEGAVRILDSGGDPQSLYLYLAQIFTRMSRQRELADTGTWDPLGKNAEQQNALQGTIAGEMILYEAMVEAALESSSVWNGYLFFSPESQDDFLVRSESPMSSFSHSPYLYGASLVSDAWKSGQADAVNEVFSMPPGSVKALAEGYSGYRSVPPTNDSVIDSEPILSPALSEFQQTADFVFGWRGSKIFLQRLGTYDDRWQADKMWVFEREGATASIWVLVGEYGTLGFDLERAIEEKEGWRIVQHDLGDNSNAIALIACDDLSTLDDWEDVAQDFIRETLVLVPADTSQSRQGLMHLPPDVFVAPIGGELSAGSWRAMRSRGRPQRHR